MNVTKTENLPPPPGIINSIKAGFDIIATHITAILLPLLLNLFLWLGPRLRMDALFNSVKDDVLSIWKTSGIPAEDIQRAMDLYENTIPRINLFWIFHTIPIGISSLFLPQGVSQTPLGDPAILQVSAASLLGWIFLLTLFGWIGGGMYFRSVAWLAMADKDAQPLNASRAIVQTVLISIFWGILALFIGMPVFFVLAVVLQFNAFIANLLVLFLSLASMWVIVPLFFWPHGVFIKQQNVITSILSSVQMMRFTLPTSSLFVLTVFLLTFGLNFLWSIPPEDSWMTLAGIFGQSFVATALLAGSFVYYRDMNIWLQSVIEKLRSTPAVKRA
jgi:hypothetical protein